MLTVLLCAAANTRLLHLGVEAAWWRERRLRDWLRYVALPPVLVPRLHEGAPGREGAARPLILGACKIGAGAALLAWAFQADLGRWSFGLDHSVKMAGVLLCFFDGQFVLQTGLLRLLGVRVLDLSREPAGSATPADFWRRYNCEAGRLLREDLFRPLEPRTGRLAAVAIVFAVNGLLHEFLAWQIVGRVQGYQLAYFAAHAAAVAATWRWKPRGWMKGVAWAGTTAFGIAASVLFFGTVQQFIAFYPRGGLLP